MSPPSRLLAFGGPPLSTDLRQLFAAMLFIPPEEIAGCAVMPDGMLCVQYERNGFAHEARFILATIITRAP